MLPLDLVAAVLFIGLVGVGLAIRFVVLLGRGGGR
jgi:hypothetical protein